MGAKNRARKELIRIEREIQYWRNEIAKNELVCNPDDEVKQEIERHYGIVNELQHQRGLIWRILKVI